MKSQMVVMRKRLAILLFVIFVLSLIALAAGLSGVHFAPGKAYHIPGSPPSGGSSLPDLPGDRWKDYLNMIFWSFCGLVLVAGLIAAIFSKEYRRELLITLLVALPVILGGVFALRAYLHSHPEFPDLPEQPAPQPERPPEAPLPQPSHVPNWTSFLLFVVVLAAAGLILWRIWPYLRPREETLGELAGLAAGAAAELRAGKDLKDTIMRCYRDMSELLARRGHIPEEVRRVLTPREFEAELRRLGMADEHVTRLSRLFERVRYGGHRADPAEEREAIACLEAIERAYGYQERSRLEGEAVGT